MIMAENTIFNCLCDEVVSQLYQLNEFKNQITPNIEKIIKKAFPVNKIIQFREALEKDSTALGELASKSYLHENSFYKLTLIEVPNSRFRLRLHLWTSGVPSDQFQNIHNHRFGYYSHILKGTLVNKIWKKSAYGNEFHHYKYYSRLKSQSYTLDYCGTHSLDLYSEKMHMAGEIYSMESKDLHDAYAVQGDNLITLFIEEREHLRPYADVFSNKYSLDNTMVQSPSVTSEQYLTILDKIINLLTSRMK